MEVWKRFQINFNFDPGRLLFCLYIQNPETDEPLWYCLHIPKTEEPISAIKILYTHCEQPYPQHTHLSSHKRSDLLCMAVSLFP